MWHYKTKIGTFIIARSQEGSWRIKINDEDLGGYITPQQALDDLSAGHSFWPSCGTDPGDLNIPDDLEYWREGSL